jgi:hypothetical protein
MRSFLKGNTTYTFIKLLENITMHSLGTMLCSFRVAHRQSEPSYKDDQTTTGGAVPNPLKEETEPRQVEAGGGISENSRYSD